MRYIAEFSCKVGDYSIQWKKVFKFRKDAKDALLVEVDGIKRHFGEENIKELSKAIHETEN